MDRRNQLNTPNAPTPNMVQCLKSPRNCRVHPQRFGGSSEGESFTTSGKNRDKSKDLCKSTKSLSTTGNGDGGLGSHWSGASGISGTLRRTFRNKNKIGSSNSSKSKSSKSNDQADLKNVDQLANKIHSTATPTPTTIDKDFIIREKRDFEAASLGVTSVKNVAVGAAPTATLAKKCDQNGNFLRNRNNANEKGVGIGISQKRCDSKSKPVISKPIRNSKLVGATSAPNLGPVVEGFKKFLLVTTIVYMCLLSLVPSDSPLFLIMQPTLPTLTISCWADAAGGTNRELVKNIWEGLTEDEIHSIFGKSHPSHIVPNVDIVEPKVFHRKVRATRSIDPKDENNDHGFDDDNLLQQQNSKHIEISGLGRRFNLTLYQNRNLLDPNFVFLRRRDNQSEIMSEDHIRNQLDCFYQGRAEHFETVDDNDNRNNNNNVEGGSGKDSQIVSAPVALSVCGGLRGFILSSSSPSDQEHYVIHPVPVRFHDTYRDPNEKSSKKANNYDETLKHFLFRRQNKVSTSFGNPYNHLHDTNTLTNVNRHANLNQQVPLLTVPDPINKNNEHKNSPKTELNNGEGTCAHSSSLYVSSTKTNEYKDQDYDENYDKLEYNTGTGTNPTIPTPRLDRRRRSAEFMPNNPLNISPDSYWLQYRNNVFASSARTTAAAFPSSYWGPKSSEERFARRSSFINSNFHRYDDPIDSDKDKDDEDTYRDREGSPSSHWLSRSSSPYEASSGAGSSLEEPDTILPFYTKGKKRSSKINKEAWPSQADSRSSSISSSSVSSSSSSSSGGFGIAPNQGEAVSRSYSSERFGKPDNFTGNPADETFYRKGRRDDLYFGSEWKSSLDRDLNSNIMSSDKYFGTKSAEKSPRFTNDIDPGSNSIYNSQEYKQRPPAQLTIETAVFIDKDLFKHMQSNFPDDTHGEVVRIVLAMINAVQLLYHDPSLGHRVDFVLKRLEVLESDPPGLLRPYDIDRFLTNFCKWQKTENPSSDADPLHWDHALILTGLDLYVVHQSGKISNQVVGLAPVAGMCTRSSSCTVNEGRHFESVFVISHEIGHNLGMRHDGPQADNDCDPTSHIMSPTLGSGKITWSPCSRRYLDMFLETSQSKCLLDKAKSEVRLDHDADGRLPGERFDSDKQCVLKYGRGSFHATQQPLEDVCRDLHCRREHYTWTSHPALEGTYCGTDMWCRAGKCVRRTNDLFGGAPTYDDRSGDFIGSNHLPGGSETAAYSVQKAVDGGWGKWSLFTDCSSACLHSDDGTLSVGSTGIRLAARRCDSPRPENGGRQCSESDRRYKTCKANKVCETSVGRTTVSQYANEVCNRAATVDTELTGIGFMMSTNDAERACSVWCETLDNGVPRSRGWSFPDGTSCKLISQSPSQRFCVAGKCQEFACNPYSHYALSDEDCSFSTTNEVTPTSSWYSAGGSSSGSKVSSRNGKVGWTDWESQSECKVPCLAPAKGLEMVKRACGAGDSLCSGLAVSVRLCKPDKSTIMRNGCTRLQTPFEYATKVCSKYSEKITGLSGIGMQLSPTKDDKDRPCRIGCQDASIPYRFYMVNGEEGWFPPGTDCSRGDPAKKAFCLAGKCIDFGNDDTPVYKVNSKLLGRIESLFQRSKREAAYKIMEPLNVPHTLDQSSLKDLVQKFSQQTGNYPSISSGSIRSRSNSAVDFTRPILVSASGPSSDYPPISRRNPYNPDTNANTRGQSSRGYSSNYNTNNEDRLLPRPSNNVYTQATSRNGQYMNPKVARGRSLNLFDYVDVDKDIFSSNGPTPGRMLPSGHGGYPGGVADSQQQYNQNHWGGLAVEGSFYEWRMIVSDCSVSCGSGIQEIIVECISGDTKVSDELCASRPRPGRSGYANCHRSPCSPTSRDDGHSSQSSHIWNWLQSILPRNSSNEDFKTTRF